ncbi:hypothetical protein GCM10007908_03380 [Rhizobium albus]|nr:hypothetical protein GCM10007908_03380 [Rhizobium albus]
MRTISEIIAAAGGPAVIAGKADKLSTDAVYKWAKIGIPDRHWPILIELAGASPSELFEANKVTRSQGAAA